MKKIKLNTAKLQLNKEKIIELSNNQMGMINGGGGNVVEIYTSGCTDGVFCHTLWRCTKSNCTADCPPEPNTSTTRY